MHRECNDQRVGTFPLLQPQLLPRRTVLSGGLAAFALAALGCSTDSGGEGSAQAPSAAAGSPGPLPPATGGSAAQPPTGTAGAPNAGAGAMATPAAGTGAPISGTAGTPSAGMAGTMPNTGGMPAGTGGMAGSQTPPPPSGLDALQCIVTPEMTEGPFFVEEELNRSNLVMGETAAAIADAVPLKLVIGVYEVNGMTCTPLSGVQVDIWHADAAGMYSDVAAGVVQSVDTRGKTFLRGYQISDEQGVVQFETVYPGWYRSRAIHIHFKLRMLGSGAGAREFVSQMFFDEAINTEVLARAPYSNRTDQRTVLNDDDHIYNGTATNGQPPPAGTTPPGQDIMPELVAEAGGYTATLKIGLQA